jgi:hypothetical protein
LLLGIGLLALFIALILLLVFLALLVLLLLVLGLLSLVSRNRIGAAVKSPAGSSMYSAHIYAGS